MGEGAGEGEECWQGRRAAAGGGMGSERLR